MKEDENKVSESKPVDKICSEGFRSARFQTLDVK